MDVSLKSGVRRSPLSGLTLTETKPAEPEQERITWKSFRDENIELNADPDSAICKLREAKELE